MALSAVALVLADGGVRHLGVRKARGALCGLVMATCVGLFLFTRILIPDVMLTFTVALAMWAFLRALDEARAASAVLGGCLGRQPGSGTAAEEPRRRRLSRWPPG